MIELTLKSMCSEIKEKRTYLQILENKNLITKFAKKQFSKKSIKIRRT